ncbi:serine protease [Photobacterium gaetbulicola]|uniref:Peptidase S1 domain-containing protein n=1 Tax=Photobacterium gaetbulicola Gung47 TaxID=658445 RepID=A0A0C5WFG9_9GAMM|nr:MULTISPECIES: serine protease [Photobacterium]AJR05873.1 hypothetical protein H744_1c0848 [Photobacterium gaetbulicola Gung47]PSU13311.1 serine protease [Photobacterium gaetbulicola]WEM45732.1 serine protease [Photobacterium sp. DA100]
MRTTFSPIALAVACTVSFSAMANEPQIQTRILNGDDASKLSEELLLPWQAAMLTKPQPYNNNRITSGCGAVVISEYWLATAAHCIIPEMSDKVVVGTDVISNKNGTADQIEQKYLFTIVDGAVHEGYHPKDYPVFQADNDIALLKVDRSMLDVAKPIKIATPQEQQDINREFEQTWNPSGYSNANLIASGWGYHEPVFDQPDNLMVVKLGGVPMDKCVTNYQMNEESHFVCADSNTPDIKKDVCRGDSGGPLIWQNPAHVNDPDYGLRVIGVVSNGPLCNYKVNGDPGAQTAGLYTELSTYYNWIETKAEINLSKVEPSSFSVDPFTKVTDNKSDNKGGTNKGGSGGGGSLPLSGLLSLAALALLRRKTC